MANLRQTFAPSRGVLATLLFIAALLVIPALTISVIDAKLLEIALVVLYYGGLLFWVNRH